MARIEIISLEMDDHLPCPLLKVGEHKIKLWWASYETYGALMYSEDPLAKKHLEGFVELVDKLVKGGLFEGTRQEEQDSSWGYID